MSLRFKLRYRKIKDALDHKLKTLYLSSHKIKQILVISLYIFNYRTLSN